jgi:hypothetical protein
VWGVAKDFDIFVFGVGKAFNFYGNMLERPLFLPSSPIAFRTPLHLPLPLALLSSFSLFILDAGLFMQKVNLWADSDLRENKKQF